MFAVDEAEGRGGIGGAEPARNLWERTSNLWLGPLTGTEGARFLDITDVTPVAVPNCRVVFAEALLNELDVPGYDVSGALRSDGS